MAPLRALGGKPIELTPGGGDLRRSSVPLSDFFAGTTELWNRTVSHREIYKTQPIVGSVANKITRQVSRLPMKLYESGSQPGSKIRVRSGDAARVLRSPAPGAAPISWKQWVMLPAVVEGNGLLRKARENGETRAPSGLRRVDWRHAAPIFDDPGAPPTAWWVGDPAARSLERVPASDMIHMAWESFEQGIGISPLHHLGTTLAIEDAAQGWQISNLQNASRPPGVVNLDDRFLTWTPADKQELLDQATAQFREHYTGPERAGRPLVLPPGFSWQNAGFSAHDAELIRQRDLARQEVCVVYDMPEVMLGIMENATLANVETWGRLLFTHVLGPWIVLLEETMQAQLIDNEPAWNGLFLEFELAEVLRGDTLKEITALRLAVMAGLMTINEARATRNLPALDFPYCDEPLVPVNNMAPVSLIGEAARTSAGSGDADAALAAAAISNFLSAKDNDDAALGDRLLNAAAA